jgi:hypothetical protein
MSFKTLKLIPTPSIKGDAILQLAQNALGADEFGEAVFGGAFAGTGVAGFAGTATVDGVTNALSVVTVTNGLLSVGSVLTATGVPGSTTITGQTLPLLSTESLGGIGRYTMSANSTSAQVGTALTATALYLTITAVSAGVLGEGNTPLLTGLSGSPTIVVQVLPLLNGEALGGVGRYTLSSLQLAASGAVTTAAATALVDGDSVVIFTGKWQGRAHYEANTDVTNNLGRRFWFKLMTVGALTLADSTLNNTTAGIVRNVGIVAHGLVVGSVFSVGTEFFRVLVIKDVNTVDVLRGYAGSTVATHASTTGVGVAANYTGVNLAVDLIVPVTALAIATSGPQMATGLQALDGFNARDLGSVGMGYRSQPSLGFGFIWEYISAATRLFFHRPSRTGHSGSTTVGLLWKLTNGFGTEQPVAGVEKAEVKRSVVARAPTTAEVLAGYMDFAFELPIKTWAVSGFVTATLASVAEGATVSFSADFKRLTLTNNATNNFAATQTVKIDVTF